MSNCCNADKPDKPRNTNTEQTAKSSCCDSEKQSFDWLLWGSVIFVSLAFVGYWLQSPSDNWFYVISATTVEMLNAMWIGRWG